MHSVLVSESLPPQTTTLVKWVVRQMTPSLNPKTLEGEPDTEWAHLRVGLHSRNRGAEVEQEGRSQVLLFRRGSRESRASPSFPIRVIKKMVVPARKK